jgi:protein TonB
MGLHMFEDSLVESSGKLKSKSSRYMWATGAFNATVVAVGMLIPLLYPEALPKTAMTAMLSAPPPPPAPPPTPLRETAIEPLKATAPIDPFTAPSKVPTRIDTTHEDPPQGSPDTSVVGMVGAVPGGLSAMSAIGLGSAPPVVKVAPPKPTAPARISSGIIAGNKLSGPNPVYPPIAKAAHVAGSVVLHAIISKTGSIQSLSVISGPEMLRANAVAAVQEWKYKPYLLNGEPTEVDTTITVNFSFGG